MSENEGGLPFSADPVTTFYECADGSLLQVTSTNTAPSVPDGCTEIFESAYEAQMAAAAADKAAADAAQAVAENEALRLDYEALIALGLPPATAERITGYKPPVTP